jgi:hypothetical protein
MLLAAFAAGATVLVIVNFGSYFISQQRLQEERGRLQQDLIRDAEALDRKIEDGLRNYTDRRIARVEERQAAADVRMDQLSEIATSGSRTASAASVTVALNLGDELEESGQHVVAAMTYAQGAAINAQADQKAVSNWLIGKVIHSLENARADNQGPDDTLDELVAALQAVDAAPPPDANVAVRVQKAILLVERFRAQRNAGGT